MRHGEPTEFELLSEFIRAPVRRFGLAVATADSPVQLLQVRANAAEVARAANVRLVTLEFDAGSPLLEQLLAASRDAAVIFVVGMERLLLTRHRADLATATLEQLNWDRDQLARELRARVVLWLTTPAARALATAARDLNDVVLGRYHFPARSSTTTLVAPATPHPSTPRSAHASEALGRVLTRIDPTSRAAADIALDRGRIALDHGDLATASTQFDEAIAIYDNLGEHRGATIAVSFRADVEVRRGDLLAALQLVRGEALPHALASGDPRMEIVAYGAIADHLFRIGDLEESRRVRRDDLLPRAVRLGDSALIATALGDLADLDIARGRYDEALDVLREQVLPPIRRSGDRHALAITLGKISEALAAKGDLEAALTTLRDELLPIAVELQDRRMEGMALTGIADVLAATGQLDEAARIYHDEVLPLYHAVADDRLVAMATSRLQQLQAAKAQQSA